MTEPLSSPQLDELRADLRDGQKLAAIKRYREWTGCSLIDAKHFVDALQSQGATGEVSPTSSDAMEELSDDQMDQVLDAIERGEKLRAVKLYLTFTGKSLRESKDLVESIIDELGVGGKGPDNRTGCAPAVLLLLVLGSLLFW
ncbi:hypothetical protein FYK55_21155 [Roseiconus nitratireducens]|uniref:Ribosomal L7/L12-like protein n=1 Tax=Roseiconus nitratireducens TaxID=2605748 RepID=A0A5M6D5N7_9BACT|nr:hypothetical protein [Roseiconus nitratireducens]KAA5540515.1 hypothetical protein FYK55_21155 [Roseiconus nitratireducens]